MRCGALIAAAGVPVEVEQFLPMVKVGGTSVIKRQIQGFQRLGIEPIVVVTGYHAALLERHLARSGVICVRNRQYASTRMLESIWLGMDLLEETDAMLITPATCPICMRIRCTRCSRRRRPSPCRSTGGGWDIPCL